MTMTRLVVVLPLSPLQVGDLFAVHEWPLHVTVLPPFTTDVTGTELGRVISTATREQPALHVVAAGDELFGRQHDIPVTVLAQNEQLTALHHKLRAAVRPFAAQPDEPAFTGEGFRPHVTVKSHGRVHEGDAFTLSQLAVVDMAPRASAGRTVLAIIDLPDAGSMVTL